MNPSISNHSLPAALLDSLDGVNGFDRSSFVNVHVQGVQVTSVRLNPAKMASGNLPISGRVPWSSFGYYLDHRPSFTFDPLFHAGVYYVQEASSMFLEQALRQTTDLSQPLRVLDLCAAPGGKSTLIQSLLSADSLLVSNEVIRTRVNVLRENMVKWGSANVFVTNNDPRDFASMEDYFDVIVVDAPCSGSGLFRREPEAIQEWSPENVELCHQRQQRILADCWPALRNDGILIYSTCSYSKQEDEEMLDWLMGDMQAEGVKLQIEDDWHIVETSGKKGGFGYRFYPDKLKGEGFFIACVRKTGGGAFSYPTGKKPGFARLAKKEEEQVRPWLRSDISVDLFSLNEFVYCLPDHLTRDLTYLQPSVFLKKAGVLAGKLATRDFVPEHELALSSVISDNIPVISLSGEQAIQYLRKDDLRIESAARGWVLVQYEGQRLGWIKALQGRINNYYPKEWRILKRAP